MAWLEIRIRTAMIARALVAATTIQRHSVVVSAANQILYLYCPWDEPVSRPRVDGARALAGPPEIRCRWCPLRAGRARLAVAEAPDKGHRRTSMPQGNGVVRIGGPDRQGMESSAARGGHAGVPGGRTGAGTAQYSGHHPAALPSIEGTAALDGRPVDHHHHHYHHHHRHPTLTTA